MNMRIVAFAVAGGLMLSAGAFQRPTKANCDFRAAFSKSIDWDGTLQFGISSSYDPNLGGLRTGYYTLSSDLVTGRIVMDNSASSTVFDLGEGRTMTLIGQSGTSPALQSTGPGSRGTVQLKSGTILLPASYPGESGEGERGARDDGRHKHHLPLVKGPST